MYCSKEIEGNKKISRDDVQNFARGLEKPKLSSCFPGDEESAHAADEADEGGLGEVPALEEQEGQGGPAAEGKGLWKSVRRNRS